MSTRRATVYAVCARMHP